MNDKDTILKSLQCSICMEFVPETHYVCGSIGRHKTCIMCNEKQLKNKNNCLICGDPIGVITDTILNNIYSLLDAKRSCQFSYYGCDHTMSQKDYQDHINTCEHRPIRCHSAFCRHLFNSNDNIHAHMSHMQIFHNTVIYAEINPIVNSATGHSSFRSIFTYNLNLDKPSLVKINNHLFAIVFLEMNNKWNEYINPMDSEVVIKLCWTNRTSEKLDKYIVKISNQIYAVEKVNNYVSVIPFDYRINPKLTIEFEPVTETETEIETETEVEMETEVETEHDNVDDEQ